MEFKLIKKVNKNPFRQYKLLKEALTKPKKKSTKSKKILSTSLEIKLFKLKKN